MKKVDPAGPEPARKKATQPDRPATPQPGRFAPISSAHVPGTLLNLQRTIGNRAVNRLLKDNGQLPTSVSQIPAAAARPVQTIRFTNSRYKNPGFFSFDWSQEEYDRGDKELSTDELAVKQKWQTLSGRYNALGDAYQSAVLKRQSAALAGKTVPPNSGLTEIRRLLTQFEREIAGQEREKDQDEQRRQRQQAMAKSFTIQKSKVAEIELWAAEKAKVVPGEMLAGLMERINRHLSQLKSLPAEFDPAEMGQIGSFVDSSTHTAEQTFPQVEKRVTAWEVEQAEALERLRAERAGRREELARLLEAAERAYEDADGVVELMDDIEIQLRDHVYEEPVASAVFGSKVKQWQEIYQELKAKHGERNDLANQAYIYKEAIGKLATGVTADTAAAPTNQVELAGQIKLLVAAGKKIAQSQAALREVTRIIQGIYTATEMMRRDFFYKINLYEKKQARGGGSSSGPAVTTDKVVYNHHDYFLIPRSANVYGRVTANVGGTLLPLFEDAMMRGIIASYGRGQSGVKMRDADTYEIKVRRTRLEANNASGVLRIDNTAAPVDHDGKKLITFSHSFEAH